MAKKCNICSEEAEFCIKGTSECYCQGCATESFGDITYLVKVEDEAAKLNAVIDQYAEEVEPNNKLNQE